MSATSQHKKPAIHNAMWPGIVGKGPDSEPFIDLDTMLQLTADAEVDGVKFDGVDLFLSLPHTDIDSTDDDLEAASRQIRGTQACGGLACCSGLAAHRRRFGNGFGSGPEAISDAGA